MYMVLLGCLLPNQNKIRPYQFYSRVGCQIIFFAHRVPISAVQCFYILFVIENFTHSGKIFKLIIGIRKTYQNPSPGLELKNTR